MVTIDGWAAVFAVWVGVIMMHVEGGSAVSSKGKSTHSISMYRLYQLGLRGDLVSCIPV